MYNMYSVSVGMTIAIFQVSATDSSLKKKPNQQTKKQNKTKTLGLELLSNHGLTFWESSYVV